MKNNIPNQKATVQSFAQDNCAEWNKAKQSTEEYSNDRLNSLRTLKSKCSPDERKRFMTAITAQKSCSNNLDFLIQKKGSKLKKDLIKSHRCRKRMTCRCCARLHSKKLSHRLLSFFIDINKISNVICYPVTISPENYESIEAAHKGLDKILIKFQDLLRPDRQNRKYGNNDTRIAQNQMRDGLTAWYMTKEIEAGSYENGYKYTMDSFDLIKDDHCLLPTEEQHAAADLAGRKNANSVNGHWHGMLFMRVDKSGRHTETLDYKSLKSVFNWCNGGIHVSNQIGDTQNKRRPIVAGESGIKAFLEVAKYVTKMPTKTQVDQDTNPEKMTFNKRVGFVWDVYMKSFKKKMIRAGGDLINYEVPVELDLEVPDKAYMQSMRHLIGEYQYRVDEFKTEFITVAMVARQKLMHAEDVLLKVEACQNRPENSPAREKKLAATVKGCLTTIKNYENQIEDSEYLILSWGR